MASGRQRHATPARPASIISGQSVAALVSQIAARLAPAGAEIDDPTREARDLLAALLDVPRHWPILRENKWVEPAVWQQALASAERRARGEPLAYAVGKASFRHLTLHVDARVLIPRPETEQLVELVLANVTGGVAVDVGTGSGAIALALATEGHFDRVIATDISTDALAVARANAERIGASVEFLQGDLLAGCSVLGVGGSGLGIRGSVMGERLPSANHPTPNTEHPSPMNVVVSNPPYIAHEEARELPSSVRDWEPPVALYSPRAGLAITARLVRQAASALVPGGLLALEADARRASLVAELVSRDDRYTGVSVALDLAGRERFVLARKRDELQGD